MLAKNYRAGIPCEPCRKAAAGGFLRNSTRSRHPVTHRAEPDHQVAGTDSTGHGACRNTRSVVLPRMASRKPWWPAVGIAIRSTCCCSAVSRIVSTTSPVRVVIGIRAPSAAHRIEGAVFPTCISSMVESRSFISAMNSWMVANTAVGDGE